MPHHPERRAILSRRPARATTAVFYEPSGRRWRRVRLAGGLALVALALVLAGLVVSIATLPVLPTVSVPASVQPVTSTEADHYTITSFGEGDITRVTRDAPPDDLDPALPHYTLQRFGPADKRVVLTFDDGPDRRYTPAILDILSAYHAPAAFFVLGSSVSAAPDLLQRMYREGHEIGNHTFTHPWLLTLPGWMATAELNSTQRLIQSTLGVNTVLFRVPYSDNTEYTTTELLAPLAQSTELGYYHIGAHADPKDWQRLGADSIVATTLAETRAGGGGIILLHDGGGDRRQTIEALPRLIKTLRGEGYEFVRLSDLLGVSRASLMPPVAAESQSAGLATTLGFQSVSGLMAAFRLIVLVGFAITLTRTFIMALLAVRSRRPATGYGAPDYEPLVCAVVPAYNEERVIVKTVQSLLDSDYPNLHVVVVDDGSRDKTFQVVRMAFEGHPRVACHTKPNGGKAEAINYGMQRTDAEVVIVLDADTVILPDAIGKLVRHFDNPKVGAVAGNAKVGNREGFMGKAQALEYVMSLNLDRRAVRGLNAIRVVPGAIGAWRRAAVLALGGFTHDTLAEDTDLTLRLLRHGYLVDYDEQAVALTEAPDTLGGFLKQRFRWTYGTLQAVWKHLDTAFRPRYRGLGLLAVPDALLVQVVIPLFTPPLIDLLLIHGIIDAVTRLVLYPGREATVGLQGWLLYCLLFFVADYCLAVLAFFLEKGEDRRLLPWLFFQRFVYRQLLYYIVVKTVVTALRGSLVGWGKLERKGTVQAPGSAPVRAPSSGGRAGAGRRAAWAGVALALVLALGVALARIGPASSEVAVKAAPVVAPPSAAGRAALNQSGPAPSADAPRPTRRAGWGALGDSYPVASAGALGQRGEGVDDAHRDDVEHGRWVGGG